MKRKEHINHYTLEELKTLSSKTNWTKVDALTDEELEKLIADDPEEHDLKPDWTKAKLVLDEPRKAISLRMDRDVLAWFKQQGKGYQARMRAVLRAYMESHQ